MRRIWRIVSFACLSAFCAHISCTAAIADEADKLDLFRKNTEYRDTYRLPEEEKVEVSDDRLNISLYRIDIRKALHVVAVQAGAAIAIDDVVTGEITIELEGVGFEEALGGILAGTNYIFRKVEDVYLIESKPPEIAVPPERLLAPGERPITNVFIDTDIREILHTIAVQAEVNVLTDETVEGYVTVDLKEVPLEKALEMILAPGGYTYVWREDYYLVGSPHPDNPAFQNLSKTEEIRLRHVDADSVHRLLSDFFRPYVKVDAERNVLLVSGPSEVIARVRGDVERIDRAPRQIMIEALVTEVSKEKGEEFGADWGWNWIPREIAPEEQVQGVEVTGLEVGYTSRAVGEIFAVLKALVTDGKAEIKATPRISTLDGKEAQISVERDEYYVILSGPPESPYYRLETISVGIGLKILPRIVGEDEIVMSISPEVSDVIQRGERDFPVVSRRRIQTTVRVRDGQTVIVGGLLQSVQRQLISGVPFLRKIPIIGLLFSRRTSSEEQTELVVFITPRIID